jgi:hypothetical protein
MSETTGNIVSGRAATAGLSNESSAALSTRSVSPTDSDIDIENIMTLYKASNGLEISEFIDSEVALAWFAEQRDAVESFED